MLQFRTLDNLGFHMVARVIFREMIHGLEEFIANATVSEDSVYYVGEE